MSYRLHYYALPQASQTPELCFNEEYAIAGGLALGGGVVLCTCDSVSHLVPGGILGLPYFPRLGDAADRLTFNFADVCSHVLVVTHFDVPPVALFKAVPPAPVARHVTKVQAAGWTPVQGGGDSLRVWNLTFNDGTSEYWTRGKKSPAPPVGVEDINIYDFIMYPYNGLVLLEDPQP